MDGYMGDESNLSTAAPPRPLLPPKMKVGYNYPWIANLYGNHIGPNRWKGPPDSQKDPYWKEQKDSLARNLAALASMKIVVVRMFILCQGDNYRNDLTSYPSKVPAGKWDLPATLHPLFLEHFQKMLEDFQKAEIQIIPSLIDFHFPDWEDRDAIFTDTTKRDKFLDTVLDPLLKVSAGFRSTIFAWEVINEPSWLTRSISPPLNRKVTSVLSKSNMKAFLEKALAKIQDANFESTVGHRYLEDLDAFPTGTKRQFHFYWKRYTSWITTVTGPLDILPDPHPIPGFEQTKAFVGEIDSEPLGHGELWPECDGADVSLENCLFERLKLLARKKYELAMFWPDLKNSMDDSLSMSAKAQASLVRFTKGTFPNGIP